MTCGYEGLYQATGDARQAYEAGQGRRDETGDGGGKMGDIKQDKTWHG